MKEVRRTTGETGRAGRRVLLPCGLVRWICGTSGRGCRERSTGVRIDAVAWSSGRAKWRGWFSTEKAGCGTGSECIGRRRFAEETT